MNKQANKQKSKPHTAPKALLRHVDYNGSNLYVTTLLSFAYYKTADSFSVFEL